MTTFPFSAIVGSDDYKTALLANAVDPGIGGVLAIGERGTAKSTVARAVAALLPDREVLADCAYSCAPERPFADCPDGPHAPTGAIAEPARIVELPVGATLDRLVGGFDVAEALGGGELRFQPGLLAAANRNILYVDEVNLLGDHLVDALLDAAASGVNRVEREGIGVAHAARFVLVGTMNPEEGDLRPQFLDRFGLMVHVSASRDSGQRAEIVRRRLAFERDPEGYAAAWLERDAKLRRRVAQARQAVEALDLSDAQLEFIAGACAGLGVEGMRADIFSARAACALAALDAAVEVGDDHVRQALMLALPHRVADPLRESVHQTIARVAQALSEQPAPAKAAAAGSAANTTVAAESEGLSVAPAPAEMPKSARRLPDARQGRGRDRQRTTGEKVDARSLQDGAAAIDVAATVRAATVRAATVRDAPKSNGTSRAPIRNTIREPSGRSRVAVTAADLRSAIVDGRSECLVVLAVDTSASVFAALGEAGLERCIGDLLGDGRTRRDRTAVVTFGGGEAGLLAPPTRNRAALLGLLERVGVGGTTPLAAGLEAVIELVRRERARAPEQRIVTLLLTDGRANVAVDGGDPLTEAHARAEKLSQFTTENFVLADNAWHAERLAARAGGVLVTPHWLGSGALRPAASA